MISKQINLKIKIKKKERMSQLQGQVLTDNLNIEKERPSDATKAGYWPGHVVAECLMDDTLDNSINSLNESSDKLVSYSDEKRLSIRFKIKCSFCFFINFYSLTSELNSSQLKKKYGKTINQRY